MILVTAASATSSQAAFVSAQITEEIGDSARAANEKLMRGDQLSRHFVAGRLEENGNVSAKG